MSSADFWVIVTGILVAGSCGFIGCFLVLRKLAMVGDAISHSVLLGIVLAFFATRSLGVLPMFVGTTAIGLLTAFVVELLRGRKVQEDAAIGVSFTALFALGIVLLTLYAGDVHLDAQHVLYGEIAYVPWDRLFWAGVDLGPRAVWILGVVSFVILAVTLLLFKEFKLCAFDPALAVTLGINVVLLHYVQMGMVTIAAVAAFESVGAILAVAMLIVPGATAYLLTDRLEHMLALSVAAGALSAVAGYGMAVVIDVSIAGSMAVSAGLLFLLAFLLSPRHGILVAVVSRRALTRTVLQRNPTLPPSDH